MRLIWHERNIYFTSVSVSGSSASGYTVVLGGYLQDLVPLPFELRRDRQKEIIKLVEVKLKERKQSIQLRPARTAEHHLAIIGNGSGSR